jgi:cytochrome c553
MKSLCLVTALALLVAVPLSLMAAEDGAAIYKSKCAACHGDKGEGKSAIKMPPVKGTTMTVEQLVPYLTKGEAGKTIHGKPISGLSEEQAKAVSEFIKQME